MIYLHITALVILCLAYWSFTLHCMYQSVKPGLWALGLLFILIAVAILWLSAMVIFFGITNFTFTS